MSQPALASASNDRLAVRRFRRWATAGAFGRVLEIGAGSGPNLDLYSDRATEIVAFDPDTDSLVGIDQNGNRIRVIQARAEWLPFPEATFDSAVGTLVFCSVPGPNRGLLEVRRVLKAGAPLRLVEHVLSPNPVLAVAQHVLTPGWKRVAGSCHLDRNTVETVRRAGFEVQRVESRLLGVMVGIEAVKV